MYVDITGVYFKDVTIKKDESEEINKNRPIIYFFTRFSSGDNFYAVRN